MDRVREAVLAPKSAGSLYRWLRQNHDEFAEVIRQTGRRPNWAAITKALHGEELLDSAGGKPTAERVRLTWLKVRQDVAIDRAKSDRAKVSSAAISDHARKKVAPDPVSTTKPNTGSRDRTPASEADAELEKLKRTMRDFGKYGASPKTED